MKCVARGLRAAQLLTTSVVLAAVLPSAASAAIRQATYTWDAPPQPPSITHQPPVVDSGMYIHTASVAYNDVAGAVSGAFSLYDPAYWERNMDSGAPASVEITLATDCADGPPDPGLPDSGGSNWNGVELTLDVTPQQDSNGVTDQARGDAFLSGYSGTLSAAGAFDGTNYSATVQSSYFAHRDFRCVYVAPVNTGHGTGWGYLDGYAPIQPNSRSMSAAFLAALPASAKRPRQEGPACPSAIVKEILQGYAPCFAEYRKDDRWTLASGYTVVRNNQLVVHHLALRSWTRRWTKCVIAPILRGLRITPIGTLMSNNDCGREAPQTDAYFVGQEMTWAGHFVYPRGKHSSAGWQFVDSAGFDSIGRYGCSRHHAWVQCTNAVGDSFKYRP